GERLEPAPLSEPTAVKPERFFELMKALKPDDGGVQLLGPAVELLPEPPAGFVKNPPEPPRAEVLAVLAARRLRDGRLADSPPTPLYGRSPEIFQTWTPPARLP
ncbi:MAG: hypothetical protein LBU12_07495, partial [Deltaproteobacteria bacterium]|nr:hypothetical protein [Deltaproteobacteria bacterium]